MFHSQAAKTLLTKIRSGLKKEKLSSDTHFVSNSIKLVSIGGSISGTAVTHTCTRYFPLKSEGELWVCFSVCDGLIAPCAHWPSDCEVTWLWAGCRWFHRFGMHQDEGQLHWHVSEDDPHTHTHTHVSPDPIITHTNFWGHSWSLPSTWHHQLYFDSVGHQDSQDLLVGDVLDAERQNKAWQLHNWGDTPVHTPVRSELHGGGGQVGVFVLELPIQGQAPFFTVLVKRWGQSVHFAECRAGRHLITDNSTSSCQSKAQGSLGQSAHRHPNTQVPQIKHLCTFELLIYYSCS